MGDGKGGIVAEFKTFVLRGNVVDLAVGVVMGAAFGAVVTSLVQEVITPLLGVFGTPDFKSMVFQVGEGEVRFGLFLNAVFSLLLIAIAVFFFVIKPINRLSARRKTEAPVAATTRDCPYCLSSIPNRATVCSFCTSEVEAVAVSAAEEAIDSP